MRLLPTKRVWKRLALGLAILVALTLIANGFVAWRTEARLQAKIAEIRAAGDPATIADLAPAPLPPNRNAAAIITEHKARLQEFAGDHGRFLNSSLGKDLEQRLDRGEPPTSEQSEAIRRILNKYPDVARALSQAATCDQYASMLDYSLAHTDVIQALVDQQGVIRQAFRFMDWQNQVDLADGNADQVVARGIAMLRLARSHDCEPGLVSYLVGNAVRMIACRGLYDALSTERVSDELHNQLDTELARHDDSQRLTSAIKTERAIGSAWYDDRILAAHPVQHRLFSWTLKIYQFGIFDLMEEQLTLAAEPWQEVRGKIGKSDEPVPASSHGSLADLIYPPIRTAFHSDARNQAMLRSLRVVNALARYGAQHGREANGLSEIDLPREPTLDPYSGKPLKVKNTEDGWVVYSVMDNGVDDGGDFQEFRDYGVGPRERTYPVVR